MSNEPKDPSNVISLADRFKKRDADEGKATPTGASVSIEPHFREVWMLIDEVLLEDLYEGTRRGFRMDSFYARNIAHLILRAAHESETISAPYVNPEDPDDEPPAAI